MSISEKSLQKDNYLVAFKVVLRKEDLILITHDIFGAWDIPGGRIRKDQFAVSAEAILEEKIREELGNNFEYSLGRIIGTLRVERQERGRDNETVRILAIVYEAVLTSGEPQLGSHHDELRWINPSNEDFSLYAPESRNAGWVDQLADIL